MIPTRIASVAFVMSLPDLVGGGAECGPVNPLQQLGKRIGQDRGTQFDSFQHGAADVPGRHAAFRSSGASTSAGDPAFFGAKPTAPFQVDDLRASLPSMGSQWSGGGVSGSLGPAAMEASFRQHQQRVGPAATSSATPMSSATPAWAQDFMQASRVPAHKAAAAAPAQPHMMQPRMPMATSFHRPFHAMPMMHSAQRTAPQRAHDALENVSQSTWESAFTAFDAQAQESTPDMPTSAQVDKMNADELAETAERLLDAVRHDTSEKFKQSEFLELMRKLRDRQAEVRGDNIVDHDAKGKSKEVPAQPRTQAELDAMLANARPILEQQPQRQHHAPGHAQTVVPDALADLDEFWREEDAARAAQENRAKHTFVGDGGDVSARMREDDMEASRALGADDEDMIRREYEKWTGLGANVPGATSAWEEQMDDEDFVGRGLYGPNGRGVHGAQNAEWAKLQSDWDEFAAASDGISRDRVKEPFPYEAPQYRFHDANPYATDTTRHHAMHTPTMLDTVLEHEAAVQSDPKDAMKWYTLGLRQQENERETQAIAALHEALKIDPHMKDAWLALAVSYTNENDRDEALEALDRWINVNAEYEQVVKSYIMQRSQTGMEKHRRLANVLMAMARAGSQNASEPIDADVQVALGVLFNSSSEYDKAVDCFKTALHVRPEDWILYNRIGATLSNSGRSEESLEYYQQALSLRPDFARCHFNLSISCLNLKVRRATLDSHFRCTWKQPSMRTPRSPYSRRPTMTCLAPRTTVYGKSYVCRLNCTYPRLLTAECAARTWRACARHATSTRSILTKS